MASEKAREARQAVERERDAAIKAKEEFSAHAVRAATERNEALRAKEAAEARVEALTAKLQRARDFIKFAANSEGGLVAEIDAALEGGTGEVKGGR